MIAMMARPKTVPWMPGSLAPMVALSASESGTNKLAPMTGPQAEPNPPNMLTMSAWAETSMPKADTGVTMSSSTA